MTSTPGDTLLHAETPGLQSAAIDGCGTAGFYDTGHIVYILVDRACASVLGNGSQPVGQLTWGTSNSTTVHSVVFPAFDTPVTVEFEPGDSRAVSVHRRGTWRTLANQNTWHWRDSAGLLVKDGGLYLLGGWADDDPGDTGFHDVWFTSDLQNWKLLTPAAPWEGRHGAAWLVHNNRLYVMGGDLIPDTWSSADGIDWRQENGAAPFGKRYTPVAISDGSQIILYEGQYWSPYDWCAFQPECAAVGLNDVWRSPDAASWEQVTAHAPWSGRGLVHGGAYFRGRIYVIGGGLKLAVPGATISETVAQFSDIWSSGDGGATWRLEATHLGFPPRTHFALTAAPGGCYVANGSIDRQENTSSDAYFAPDCIHFSALPPSNMPPRHASSIAYFNGSIVIMGGHTDTSIYQYFPEGIETGPTRH
ncbi:MAG: hypothetical protein JSR67_10585 [Proteobacteria bacterium]|nr:hypothetical protein [Pseudomonadota bacterium]